MVCEVRPGGHYGYRGPRNGQPPDLPLVYLPRGLDNSSGARSPSPTTASGRSRARCSTSPSAPGTYFLLLREKVDGQPQGAVVPLPGEFLSGVHRGRFNPEDGQLYVSGMAGWGTYTPPTAASSASATRATRSSSRWHSTPTRTACSSVLADRSIAASPSVRDGHFAQAWNYRYSSRIRLARALADAIPASPATTRWRSARRTSWPTAGRCSSRSPSFSPSTSSTCTCARTAGARSTCSPRSTSSRRRSPGSPAIGPVAKTIAAHPILADMAALAHRPVPNPWRGKIRGARAVTIEAGKNLSYTVRSFTVRAGEPIQLTFLQPGRRAAQLGADQARDARAASATW